jgi:hypothetical protein
MPTRMRPFLRTLGASLPDGVDGCQLLAGFSGRVPVEFPIRAPSIGEFPVEGRAICDTAAQELRPLGHGKILWDWLRQQAPKLRMVPAQVVTAAVAVSANASTQPDHLGNEFVSREFREIVIRDGHDVTLAAGCSRHWSLFVSHRGNTGDPHERNGLSALARGFAWRSGQAQGVSVLASRKPT